MKFEHLKLGDHFLVTDYVANGSFASLKENVEYLDQPDYAHLLRLTDHVKGWNGKYVYVSKDSYDFLNKSNVYPGDLIISNVGQPGIAFIAPDLGMPVTLGPNCILVRAKSNKVNNEYLSYYINSPKGQHLIRKISSATTLSKFNKTIFRALEIPFPSLQDQIKIALILKKVEDLIAQRKDSLLQLNELVKSTFLDMFGDPVKNEKNWDKDILRNLAHEDCPLSYGIVQPGEEFQNGTLVVRPVDLNNEAVYTNGLKRIDPEISNKFSRTILKGNEILMSVRGTTGTLGYSTPELKGANVTRGIVPIWFTEKVKKYFAFGLFSSPQIQRIIQKETYGATLQQINLKNLREIELICPPLKEQEKYSRIIEIYESLKLKAKNSLVEIENLYGSLSQRAFKGDLDLSKLSIDHIVPRSKGGSDEFENLQVLTQLDNLKKSDKMPEQWEKFKETEKEKEQEVVKIEEAPKKKVKSKLITEGVTVSQLAEWIKEEFDGKYFTSEMLIRFCKDERVTFPYYFTSKELKENRKADLAQDLKEIIFQAINKENEFLKLEQFFYNGEKENFVLEVRAEDYDLIEKKSPKERSGIYLKLKK